MSPGGHVPLLFALCFVSPTFSRADIICTNAHGSYWMIGAIFVKFGQLILVKIIKIVVTRCQISRLKCIKLTVRGAYSTPQTPSWI